MVKVNGTDFPIYLMDSTESVKERIAVKFSSLPKYIHFDTELKFTPDDYEIKVTDILSIIKDYSEETEFSKLAKRVLPLMNPKLRLREDVFEIWLVYNKVFPTYLNKPEMEILITVANSDASSVFGKDVDIKRFLSIHKDSVKDRFEKELFSLSSLVRKEIILYQKFETVKDGVYYTEFEVDKASFDITIDIPEVSLMEIFNRLKLNSMVPFATYNNYYKILKDFIPLSDWSRSSDDMLMMRVLQRNFPKEMKDEYYSYAFIKEKNDKTILNINISPSKFNIDKKDYAKRIFSVLGNVPVIEVTEDDVKGVFYIPNQSLNKYVLADLIMNNPIFSNFLVIDEHEKLTKKRSEIIIKFKHKKYGMVTSNIIEKFREKDGEVENKSLDIFPMGSRYLRVHVSMSRNIEVVRDFQDILSKLFKLYNDEYINIVQIYREYIPKFAVEKPQKIVKDVRDKTIRLKDVAPKSLYKSDPTKKVHFDCNNKPRVVSKEEAEEIQASGRGDYMLFPKNSEYMEPQYLVCTEHPTHPYPGVKPNPYPSKSSVPVLPCCFIDNQQKPGSDYRRYYDDELQTEQVSRGKNLITTNKFVQIKQPGVLPDEIKRFFEIIDPQGSYFRTGMSRSKNSFIECVLDALSIDEFEYDIYEPDKRKKICITKREELVQLAGTGICRQEIYDSTTEEIQKFVADQDFYFSPRLFVRLLESKYDCNIFIFNRDSMNKNAELILPRFSQSHLKFKNNNPCVFIYEHIGAPSNMAEYPQCDLIIKNITKDQSAYSFDSAEIVSIKMKRMFNNIRKAYQYNKTIPETLLPTHQDLIMKKQVIDPSGKCRMLYCDYKGQDVSLILSPIPPLAIEEVEDITLQKIDMNVAREMIKTLGMTLVKQSVVKGVAKELITIYGNVSVTIPVNDISEIPDVQKTNKMVLNQSTLSALDVFNYNKKMARYMVEYVFWLFSKYLYSNGVGIITDDVINEFVEKTIYIQPDFKYGKIPITFSTNGGFMDGRRLVVKSDETLRRLMYVLRLGLIRENKKIMNYHTHTMIENYYLDITDFDRHPYQVILFGPDSINKWIQEKLTEQHKVHEEVLPHMKHPYFFKNTIIDNKIYLAQNTSSMNQSYDIVQNWYENKYNIGYIAQQGEKLKGTLYAYTNSKNIVEYSIPGKDNIYNFKVVGYKYKDGDNVVSGFTVLLPLVN